MDALSRIHLSLRAGAVLLDLHPQPENPQVEVWQQGRVEPLGQIDQEEDIREILEARTRLDLIEGRGWFVTERRTFFDLAGHFPSVEAWREYQAQEGYTGVMPDEVASSARHLLATEDGELIVQEPIRASLLRRVP